MEDGTVKIIIGIIVGFVLIQTCSNLKEKRALKQQTAQSTQWQKSPVDKLIRKMDKLDNYSILLYDMDVRDANSNNPSYMHMYTVITEKEDSVESENTSWEKVTPDYFNKNIDNLGMELISKVDGKLHKEVAPAGYSNYVGNPKYGEWQQRDGMSFWGFYGRYAFMSSMFNLMTYPARRSYWNDYRGGYYGTGRGYYGPSGSRVYGTKSYTSSTNGKNTTWSKSSSAFKSKVRNNVKRSSTASSSKKYSSSSSYNQSRTTRSSTRSHSSTSYRSRSGGYGK